MNNEHSRTQPKSEPDADHPGQGSGSTDDAKVSPLRSVFSDGIPALLRQLKISLVVSTYQAGFLMVLRADDVSLNTHFRRFPRPMGMAADAGVLALGTTGNVIEFRNMEAMAKKLSPGQQHDACYLPRDIHITGNIDVHEMAWSDGELWLVNTRFSCLCTVDKAHSFVPRWQPGFVSQLIDDDRCHLNGLGLAHGRPRYVTALGISDEVQGWRQNKARGGVVIDVDSGETIAAELSMPHSPRWHDGQLWVLESGDGSVGTVDLSTGRYEALVKLDGFTRGMALVGPFAFIGLSQVRESAVFSGIPLTERLKQRVCGVSIVHLPSAREVGFVRFQDAIQEIFAVEALPHRFPDVLEPGDERVGNAYAVPDQALTNTSRSTTDKRKPS